MWRFILSALIIWAGLHAYVFWRLGSVPLLARHLTRLHRWLLAALLWASFPLARWLTHRHLDALGVPLEFAANIWMGTLFLLFSTLLALEPLTLGGWLFRRAIPTLRTTAVAVALTLAGVALVQGLRAPTIQAEEITLPGLPPALDGLTLATISDLHLGTIHHEAWLRARIDQLHTLQADAILVVGDLVDSDVRRVEPLLPILKTLHAPLGVWAVYGNHDTFGGGERTAELIRTAGFRLLRDECAPLAPGLTLAGVDDLGLRRHTAADAVTRTLSGRPAGDGATILLSHTPMAAETAATHGAQLMLSGHTHAGQLWPFGELVRLVHPLFHGRYNVAGMQVYVSRGAGTWGPPMRLWQPGEIVLLRLRTGHPMPGTAQAQ